jgi:hypothetical protein
MLISTTVFYMIGFFEEIFGLLIMKLHAVTFLTGAGMAYSVQRLATGWTTERSEFKSRWG